MEGSRRVTIYFAPDLHQALRMKSATTERSVSDLVNDAVRRALAEDADDLEAIESRAQEPAVAYATLVKSLKRSGKL